MPVTIGVLAVGAAAALGVAWLTRRSAAPMSVEPSDTEAKAVEAAAKSTTTRSFIRRFGARVAGSTAAATGLVVVLALAAAAGAILDMVNRSSGLAKFDRAVAEWGAANATEWSTRFLEAITHLGSSAGAIVASAIAGYTIWRRTRNVDALWFLTAVYGGHAIISNVVKLIVDRERPHVEHLVGTLSSSFPSTHSGTAAAVWAAIALVVGMNRSARAKALLAGVAVTITALVAASRALLGVHWLTDVVAGVAIGLAWFLLVAIAFGGERLRLGEPAKRAVGAAPSN